VLQEVANVRAKIFGAVKAGFILHSSFYVCQMSLLESIPAVAPMASNCLFASALVISSLTAGRHSSWKEPGRAM